MQLLKRIGYFLIGASISCVGVYFFWQQKNATFDYGMDARTLKTIRIRDRVYSEKAQETLLKHNLDSTTVNVILKNGDVHFGESKPRIKPCPEYLISGKNSLKNIQLYIKRCDSVATIQKVIIN
ncbi:MAG: DUF4258 domain-containing protein [Polaribacter sp.]|nr:DUF4258 domain-containing protein [Polaribacter sp.]MDG1811925.1 DUF4258 domain-containing protein [Polaribacter sp.]MDG1994178.1 DUF4258 domain-containing protein [Polaribacter sp.]